MKPLRNALCLAALASATYADAAKQSPKEVEPATVGVELGDFMIRDVRATEGLKIRMSFKLYAEVPADLAPALEASLERRKHRVRGEVITAVRTAEQSEFQDADLERFRRRVQSRLRRSEPKLPIKGLLIGEFEYFTE